MIRSQQVLSGHRNFCVRLQEDRKKHFFLGNGRPQSSNLDGTRYCPCGRKALLETEDGKLERGKMETSRTLARRANETGAVCRACLGRRAWVDSVSARLLMVACRKVTASSAYTERRIFMNAFVTLVIFSLIYIFARSETSVGSMKRCGLFCRMDLCVCVMRNRFPSSCAS